MNNEQNNSVNNEEPIKVSETETPLPEVQATPSDASNSSDTLSPSEDTTPVETKAPDTYRIYIDPKTGQYSYSDAPTAPVNPSPANPTPEVSQTQPDVNPYPTDSQNSTSSYTTPTYDVHPISPAPQKKGGKGFMVVLIVLLAIFATGFFMLCGYLMRDTMDSKKTNTVKSTEPTSSQQVEKATEPYQSNVIPADDGDTHSEDTYITLHSLPADKNDTSKYTTEYAYNIISESTVGVVCYQGNNFSTPVSQGTGIVISSDGYIVTNSHVIGDSKDLYEIRVTMIDGTTYEAKVVGFDTRTDLAALKINGENLKAATFADSDEAYIGQDVIAVGNPGGMDFQNSLTKGILSAKDRKLNLSSQVSFLQTDAAINPGNSGGPLCNLHGQVVGITSAKISSSSYEGMGFAIPSTTVKSVVDSLIQNGFVEGRVRIGITGQVVTSTMAKYYGIPEGILVSTIDSSGPCADTELQVDDIITAFEGKAVSSFSDMYNYLAEHNAGDKVTLSAYRMDTDETFEISIVLVPDNAEE